MFDRKRFSLNAGRRGGRRPGRRGPFAGPVFLVIVTLAGCTSRDTENWVRFSTDGSENVVDNSGTVVESSFLAPGSQLLRLEVSPDGKETEDLLFHTVGALQLESGVLVIGSEASGEIGFFDSKGRYLRSVGRIGNGPGEFRWLTWIGECSSDSVFAYDRQLRRISVFDSAGVFAYSFPLRLSGGISPDHSPAYTLTCDRQGRLLALGWPGSAASYPEGPYRTEVSLELFDRNGIRIRGYAGVVGPERYRFPETAGPRPLGKNTSIAIWQDRIVLGTADGRWVALYDFGGALVDVIRWAGPDLTIRDRDIDAFVEATVSQFEDPEFRERARSDLLRLTYPESLPAYSGFLVNRNAELWIAEHRRQDDPETEWVVFDESGALAHRIKVPKNLKVMQVNGESLIAVWKDELGLEHVHIYSIPQ